MAPVLSWLWMFLILLSGFHTQKISCQYQDSQRNILLRLKNSTNYNIYSSTKLAKWSEASFEYCDWEGVSCDKEGIVVGLSLQNEGISDGLDDESALFDLQHLESLDLSFNVFNSLIPSRIGDLLSLKLLNLSAAGFVGQIPREMSRLTKLTILDVSNFFYVNYPLKLERPSFGELVQNMSVLEELYLDNVPVSLGGSEWGRALSSSLPNLRVLSLSNCNLSGPFDQSLASLRSLSAIHLHNNNLSSKVPMFFANFSELTSLSLWNCELYGEFPREIFKVSSLTSIYISHNPLLQGSLPEFHENNTLRSLSVSSNSFSKTLPGSMAKLTQLLYLDLSFNRHRLDSIF